MRSKHIAAIAALATLVYFLVSIYIKYPRESVYIFWINIAPTMLLATIAVTFFLDSKSLEEMARDQEEEKAKVKQRKTTTPASPTKG